MNYIEGQPKMCLGNVTDTMTNEFNMTANFSEQKQNLLPKISAKVLVSLS